MQPTINGISVGLGLKASTTTTSVTTIDERTSAGSIPLKESLFRGTKS